MDKKNIILREKLDGVGPIDNRPSTDKLQHFVKTKLDGVGPVDNRPSTD